MVLLMLRKGDNSIVDYGMRCPIPTSVEYADQLTGEKYKVSLKHRRNWDESKECVATHQWLKNRLRPWRRTYLSELNKWASVFGQAEVYAILKAMACVIEGQAI